jgi:hypothetical protein
MSKMKNIWIRLALALILGVLLQIGLMFFMHDDWIEGYLTGSIWVLLAWIFK